MVLKRSLVSLLLLCLLAAAPARADEPRWGQLCTITAGSVPVRENPEVGALQVRVLKAGQKVRVDFPEDGWAAVFDPKEPVRSELKAIGYARLAELKTNGTLQLAQATSIEVRKASPDAKPEVRVDGKPEKGSAQPDKSNKSEKSGKPDKSATAAKPEASDKAAKPGKPSKADAKPGKDALEIRVADRQLTVRARPDKDSEFRKVLHAGQRVRVAHHSDGWYAVFAPDEKSADLSRALGYSRDKYLVPESAYSGPAYVPPAPKESVPAPQQAPQASPAKPSAAPAALAPAKGQKGKAEAQDDDAVGYAVLERRADQHRPGTTLLRVRLEYTQPPAPEVLRRVLREIWKAERKKNENLELEAVLTGQDVHGLAYATARFHEDGRLKEFWWRDVVAGKPKK